jgi:predicted O-linked N-acetylglucosamine transferase (SPINDLY family)
LGEAVGHHQAGRLAEAEALYRQVLALEPRQPDALHLLGVVASQTGRPAEAVELIGQAIAVNGKVASCHSNLGLALQALGRLDEAVGEYRRALALEPRFADALNNLGNALQAQGKHEEAVERYERALAVRPGTAATWMNLGTALASLGRFAEALAKHEQAVALQPEHAAAHVNLALAAQALGDLERAQASLERALALAPDLAEAHANLGKLSKDQGRLEEAVASFERALERAPTLAAARMNLLDALCYSDRPAAAIFEAHVRHGSALQSSVGAAPAAHANSPEPERRLKVGYVSGDFRRHSVASFLEPLLRAHDHQAFEWFGYAEVAAPDEVTHRLRSHLDHWTSTVGLSDEALAQRIRADGIDLLIDLAGHTAHNRLLTFARKPASVQLSWLGYPNTTGLQALDHRLVDAVTDPPGAADALATETLVRLEDGFLCYAPPADAPPPGPLPALASGRITFGSFNNLTKLSPSTVEVWSRVLQQVPESRLLLKAPALADAGCQRRLRQAFAERGLAEERLEILGPVPGARQHLATYDRVDVALDPFPYGGTTTTCEALWMGVPVITLAGDRHAGRVGASLLQRVGLEAWVAPSAERYVELAIELAHDRARLAELRSGLRSRMAGSPLCDGPRFARKMEATYRRLWQQWCARATRAQ